MKILLIGGTGTIGRAVKEELSKRHTVLVVSHEKSDLTADLSDTGSLERLFKKTGTVDAIACAAGSVVFKPLSEMTEDDYRLGLHHKLMGQVNLVRIGQHLLSPKGSFTLISGILNRDPIHTGTSAAMVNGALEGFVRSVALELPNQLRINLVSPTVVEEAMPVYAPYFRGFKPVPAAWVGLAFSKSIEGSQTGQVYYVD